MRRVGLFLLAVGWIPLGVLFALVSDYLAAVYFACFFVGLALYGVYEHRGLPGRRPSAQH